MQTCKTLPNQVKNIPWILNDKIWNPKKNNIENKKINRWRRLEHFKLSLVFIFWQQSSTLVRLDLKIFKLWKCLLCRHAASLVSTFHWLPEAKSTTRQIKSEVAGWASNFYFSAFEFKPWTKSKHKNFIFWLWLSNKHIKMYFHAKLFQLI